MGNGNLTLLVVDSLGIFWYFNRLLLKLWPIESLFIHRVVQDGYLFSISLPEDNHEKKTSTMGIACFFLNLCNGMAEGLENSEKTGTRKYRECPLICTSI